MDLLFHGFGFLRCHLLKDKRQTVSGCSRNSIRKQSDGEHLITLHKQKEQWNKNIKSTTYFSPSSQKPNTWSCINIRNLLLRRYQKLKLKEHGDRRAALYHQSIIYSILAKKTKGTPLQPEISMDVMSHFLISALGTVTVSTPSFIAAALGPP